MDSKNLISCFEEAIRSNWDRVSLSDYGNKSYYYRDVAERINSVHSLYKASGIKKGDKIALLGKNSASWGIVFLGTLTYGAVIVPVLPDFKSPDVHHIVTHSDSVILFVEESLFKSLDTGSMPHLKLIVAIPDFTVLYVNDSLNIKELPGFREPGHSFSPGQISFADSHPDDVMVISYTSGTTGFSKGVILQHKSLLGNILFAQRHMPLNPGDRILSVLPVAHMFGCTFEFLFPFTLGCGITFLNRIPSPAILIQALSEIRPALILTVPVLIEKIYKSKITPLLRKPIIRIMMSLPFTDRLLYKMIKGKLLDFFGGNIRELVIGGAALNPNVEQFLGKIKFPYTVGYGMTECGPLISYASWKTTRPGACGRIVDELEIRIDSDDPLKNPGEILVRGSHVTLGYYKNEEVTKKVIDQEGWLHTGDLGIIDKEGNIFIKGRSKSMILGPSGQNIYPEELESRLNSRFLVMESLVIERNLRLVALICPDKDAMDKASISREQLPEIFRKYIAELNRDVSKYMNISDFEIRAEEFEKTPKRSIKRFLYQ